MNGLTAQRIGAVACEFETCAQTCEDIAETTKDKHIRRLYLGAFYAYAKAAEMIEQLLVDLS
jgi:hypothetical protein